MTTAETVPSTSSESTVTTSRAAAPPAQRRPPGRMPVAPVVPSQGVLHPLGLDEVRITGGHWAGAQERNRTRTLPHIVSWLDKAGWAGNFDDVASKAPADQRRGREFTDSEIYKTLEALAWQLAWSGDQQLSESYAALVDRVADAQAPDGYINTNFGRPGQAPRYSDLEWGHELYCMGHLIQAATARVRTGHRDLLVEVGVAAADHICREFGPDGRDGVCGHAEIEVALAEFGRALGEPRYVEQAALFIERRGHRTLADIEFGRSYYQDDVPFRAATSLRGHAVRALYLASGAVDVAVEIDDDELLQAARTQLRHAVERRTYLTGGMGSQHQDEAFGEDWALPSDRSYSETCAGVASVMLNWRLLLATGLPQHADLIERTLYNVVSTSPDVDGTAFFYTNPLQQRTPGQPVGADTIVPRAASSLRGPWFEVSCCPPNVARTLASLAGYLATRDPDGVQIHQYTDCEVSTRLDDGCFVGLAVTTSYPAEGSITVRVTTTPTTPWTLTLRVPHWAQGAVLSDANGERGVEPGVVGISRVFTVGETVVLQLPVEPRWVRPDRRIDAIRGCVAVERGPQVLCVESVDLPEGVALEELEIDCGETPIDLPAAGAVSPVSPVAAVRGRVVPSADGAWPYRGAPVSSDHHRSVPVRLVPYSSWGNRGPATMRVWLPVDANR